MKARAIAVGLLLCALAVTGATCPGTIEWGYSAVVMGGHGTVHPEVGTAPEGSEVVFTATPASGYQFDHWEGDASGSQNPLIVTIDGLTLIYAYFTEDSGSNEGDGTGDTVQKPDVDYIPEDWYLSDDDAYSPSLGYGKLEYTDNDGDSVRIYYGDIPSSLVGEESDDDALVAQAEWEAPFTPDDSGTMFVAGEKAGFAEAYDEYWNWWEKEIVFVEGVTYVEIYARYNASFQDKQDAMYLINSIDM